MPKKSKLNKLARMSDEERARYLQNRADMEEEARRRKQELIGRFIKNKLDKEGAYCRLNKAKLNQLWRYGLRTIKRRQMGIDINDMMSFFNLLMENKNRHMTTLLNAIGDADDQHRRMFQDHTESIGLFLDIGNQRLDKLQNDYEERRNELLLTWENESQTITDKQDYWEFKLKLISFIQNNEFIGFKKQNEMQMATAVNDAQLEHEEEIIQLRIPKELEIRQLRAKMREVYNDYKTKHDPIMSHYQFLAEKDQYYQKEIVQNERQIRKASKQTESLQMQLENITKNLTSKLEKMKERKEELTEQVNRAKAEEKKAQSRSDMLMLVMVESSQKAIQALEVGTKKLNKILHLAEICQKYDSNDCFNLIGKAENSAINEPNGIFSEYIDMTQIKKLENFQRNMNHVKIQNICLKAEKNKLQKENEQLKNFIKKYLTELALKNERPTSMKLEPVSQPVNKIRRPVTCIEGTLSIAVMSQKRNEQFKRKNSVQIMAYPRIQNWM